MDLMKLKYDEIANFEAPRLREVEEGIRGRLHEIRMDIYSDKKTHLREIRALKKQLARVLTKQSQIRLVKGVQ